MSEDDRKRPDESETESIDGSPRDPDQPRIKQLGPFRLEATIGVGGMGTIYRAYDESMKRTVALKVLHASLEISKSAQARFVREAWIAGRLDHPNIIKVYTRGEENRVSYIAMELAESGSLFDYIKQTSKSIPSGADVSETTDRNYINLILEKFIGLAQALEHIHAKDFIHRDIKPHNILLAGPDRDFKLTDFGIAHAEDMTRMTRAGDFIGTVRYMSPELIAAHRGEVDKRTDIYSLGVTLYEALTLTLPFKAVSEEKLISEILAGHYIEARKTNRRISRDLETVLMKATHHDPDMRYQTAGEFADDLQRIIDGRPIVARRQSVISRGIKYLKRNYKTVSVIFLSVIVVMAGFLWQNYRAKRPGTEAERMTVRQVWAGPEVDAYGAPSADGRYLSYVDWETGDLAVRELATGKTRRLTNEATWQEPMQYALGSRISPDGKMIAYAWWNPDATSELRLIEFDGSTRRVLYSSKDYEAYPREWSSDGRQIAALLFKKGANQIVWVSVSDGAVHILKSLEKAWPKTVCHSPDDRFLAYDLPVAENSGNYDIFLLAIDGSGEIPLIEHPANDKLLGWAPGREEVLFISDRTGTWDAWVVRVVDGRPQGAPQSIKRNIGEISSMAFTQDGSYYYNTFTRNFTTCVAPFDPATGVIQTSSSKPILGSNYSPQWSPDGEHLAYVSEHTTKAGPGFIDYRGIRIRHLTTGEERDLAGELYTIEPRWSPDGRSIVAAGYDRSDPKGSDNYKLYKIDVQTGKATPLVDVDHDGIGKSWHPRHRFRGEWSGDGKSIFYVNHGSICKRDLETGQEEQLYRNPDLFRRLNISPDGQELIFHIGDPAGQAHGDSLKCTRRLMMMDISSREVRELHKLRELREIRIIGWTPDGQHILFSRYEKKGFSLWKIPSEGGDSQQLWQSEKKLHRLSLHPDGQQIAFHTVELEHEICVMENFLPEDQPKK